MGLTECMADSYGLSLGMKRRLGSKEGAALVAIFLGERSGIGQRFREPNKKATVSGGLFFTPSPFSGRSGAAVVPIGPHLKSSPRGA